MRKPLLFFTLCCFLLIVIPVQAKEVIPTSPLNWEISVLPKPTPEEIERDRWSYVFTNNIGIYVFDRQSLQLDAEDKKVVHILTKTIFNDPKIIAQLNEKYKEKLSQADKVSYSEMQMVFQIKTKTYTVTKTRVVSAQGIVLEDSQQTGKFVPVVPQTFADSMYDMAKKYEQNNNANCNNKLNLAIT